MLKDMHDATLRVLESTTLAELALFARKGAEGAPSLSRYSI